MTYYIYVWSLSLKRVEPLYVLRLFFLQRQVAKLKNTCRICKGVINQNSMEMDAC